MNTFKLGDRADAVVEKKTRTIRVLGRKVGRNSPCPCGSGKKNKDCHNVRHVPLG